MNSYLRQSTDTQTRLIGPFIDDTDFKTAKTALTIANTDVKLRANGTTLANKNSGGGTHQVNGFYSVVFDTTDTANTGELAYSVVVASALPVFGTFVVVAGPVYDALFGTTAAGFLQPLTPANYRVDVDAAGLVKANVTQVSGTAQSPGDIISRLPATLVSGRMDSYVGDGNVAVTGTPQTGDAFARLGAPVGASISADIAGIWTKTLEGALTATHIMRIMLSGLAGKLSGAATTTVSVRDQADSKNRIVATVDVDGNRTAVTVDGT